jgi:hypothetical protein
MKSKDQLILEELYDDVTDEQEELEPLYLRGEYWFDEDGNSMYADGDYGDMNHEMYVQDKCAGEVLSWFDLYAHDMESPVNLQNHLDEMISIILDRMNISQDDEEYEIKKEEIENDPYDAIINYLKTNTQMKGPIDDIVYLGSDHSSIDGREFAIKNWGWSRVHQNHIEVKELTREQLRIVARGINNGLEEEGVYGDEDWLRASQSVYNISTYTGKRYEIKLEDMEKGNVEGLERSDIENTVSAATQQVRQMDVEKMPSFYKGMMGDSFKGFQFDYLVEKYKRQSAGMDIKKIAKKHKVKPELIKKQLKIGKKVELEHGGNLKKAKKVAMDHLTEDPRYYTKLKKAKL